MKLRNYLESISGVGIFPVITLVIFFTVFVLLGAWAFIARKEHLQAMNHLPLLDDGSTESENIHPKA